MALATPKTAKERRNQDEIFLPITGAYNVRSNNSGGGGGMALDKTDILFRGASLDVVVVGYQLHLGTVPPMSNYASLQNRIVEKLNLKGPAVNQLTPQQMLVEAYNLLQPFATLHYVPVPSELDSLEVPPEKWPRNVVTSTFFRSIGLTSSGKGLFGDQGLFARLELQDKSFSEVITTINWELIEATGRQYHVNTWDFYTPDADTPEAKHIEKCQKWLAKYVKENPDVTDLPLPSSAGHFKPITVEQLMNADEDFHELRTESLLEIAAGAFEPEQLQAIDFDEVLAIAQGDVTKLIDVQSVKTVDVTAV